MSMFEFATANRILFGPGTLQQAGTLAAGLGSRICLVTGANAKRAEALINLLNEQHLAISLFPVSGEPDLIQSSQASMQLKALIAMWSSPSAEVAPSMQAKR